MKLGLLLWSTAIAISAASLGLVGSGAVIAVEPGQPESKIAAADTTGELKLAQAAPTSNPFSGNPEAIESGGKLFHAWCAQCHGANANGSKYGANLTIFALGYKEFLATVKNGRVQKMMPPWKDVLDEDAINKIGAYLETLAQPGANWK
jgi:cytochrome c oxidase cbb3-type subunit 3